MIITKIKLRLKWMWNDFLFSIGKKFQINQNKGEIWCGIHEVVFQVQSTSLEAQVLRQHLEEKPSFKIDSLIFDDHFDFENVKLNFMDIF